MSSTTTNGQFVHMVGFKFKPETTDEQKEECFKRLNRIGEIPDVISFHHGKAMQADWDHALLVVFPTQAAERAYQTHPLHVLIVDIIKPLLAGLSEIDFYDTKSGDNKY